MSHFNEISERSERTELSPSPAESNILPDHLSKEEARSFWDNRFADDFQDEDQESCKDDIWGEIFGRDEADFVFDFEIDNFPLA